MTRSTTYTLQIEYLAGLIGLRAALRLCETFGGQDRLHIPRAEKLTDDHPIVEAIGREAALKLSHAHSSEQYEIPMAKALRRAPVLDLLRRGRISHRAAARKLGLSTRRIRQIMGGPAQTGQGDLFRQAARTDPGKQTDPKEQP